MVIEVINEQNNFSVKVRNFQKFFTLYSEKVSAFSQKRFLPNQIHHPVPAKSCATLETVHHRFNFYAMVVVLPWHYDVAEIDSTNVIPLWWWMDPACRDQNDHQLPGPSYVSDIVLLSHE